MQNHDSANVWPTHTEFVPDRLEPHDSLFLICLVGEMFDTVTAFGMVPNRSTEQDNSTAVRPNGPLVGGSDRKFLCGQTEPIVAFYRCLHAGDRSRPGGIVRSPQHV